MPTFQYERTTPFSVSDDDFLSILHNPKKFLLATGTTDEASIRLDESTNLWHGMWLLIILPILTFVSLFL